MTVIHRPVILPPGSDAPDALRLAGGWARFDRVEQLRRAGPPCILPVAELPAPVRARLTEPRAALCGLALDRPRVMGVLNVTPDSFSDGGLFATPDSALVQARALAQAGADILDLGGESTRPGAQPLPIPDEIARLAPVLAGIRDAGLALPLSIDTRNADTARMALSAGAAMVNDVSALGHDPAMAGVAASARASVVLMHARGTPETMQDDPRYDDVLFDVFEALAAAVARAEAAGIPRARLVVDPGIGFGKTVAHNLALIRGLAAFHDLGCAVMLGASRKGFIGAVTGAPGGTARMPGSVAAALWGVACGVQVVRVHDVAETVQALTLWGALAGRDGQRVGVEQ